MNVPAVATATTAQTANNNRELQCMVKTKKIEEHNSLEHGNVTIISPGLIQFDGPLMWELQRQLRGRFP